MIEISLIGTVVIFKATYIISKQVHMEMLHGATGKIFTYNYDEYLVRHPKLTPHIMVAQSVYVRVVQHNTLLSVRQVAS